MHVLLITQYWEPEQGVVQRRWRWIGGDIVSSGHHLSVVAPPPHYPGGKLISHAPEHQAGSTTTDGRGITVYRSRFIEHDKSIVSRVKDQAVTMVSEFFTARKAFRKARKQGTPIDVIACTVPALPSAIVAFAIAKTHRLPFAIELRDAWPEILDYMDQWRDPARGKTRLGRSLKLFLFHWFLGTCGKVLDWVLRQADAVITTTDTLAELEKDKGCRNVVAVRNRVNGGIPNCNVYPVRGDGPLRVLYAGTVGRAQGLRNAIKALQLARDEGADVIIRIVGGGVHLKPVKKLAKQLGVPVEFTGRIPFEQMIDEYRWADTVLVHLESWTPMEYTIPSKLFEIMWAEKHVTASVAGEAADIVKESGIGHVVTPMNPEELGGLWFRLFHNRQLLEVDGRGEDWFRGGPTLEDLTERWITTVDSVRKKA